VLTGAGQLQVVVTDALGRQQVLTQPYYSGTALLRPDLAEYSFELGSIREDYGHRSFAYGDMLGVASYRRGVTDTLTAGARAEAQANGIYALGADAAWQAGVAGIVNAQIAAGGMPVARAFSPASASNTAASASALSPRRSTRAAASCRAAWPT